MHSSTKKKKGVPYANQSLKLWTNLCPSFFFGIEDVLFQPEGWFRSCEFGGTQSCIWLIKLRRHTKTHRSYKMKVWLAMQVILDHKFRLHEPYTRKAKQQDTSIWSIRNYNHHPQFIWNMFSSYAPRITFLQIQQPQVPKIT